MSDAVLATERLVLRRLRLDDDEFIVRLLNDPGFLRFIGDRKVRTSDDAREYLRKGPLDSYARLGFGLWLVSLRDSGVAIGMCGLLKRDALEDVDLGFAFLPEFRGCGYAYEAAAATRDHAWSALGLSRLIAITSRDNAASGRLLVKLGFRYERTFDLSGEDLRLYGSENSLASARSKATSPG